MVGAAGRRRGRKDGRGVPRRQRKRQTEPLQRFGLDGDGTVGVSRLLRLLQRLHHQRLRVDRWFDGRRAHRVPVGLRCGAGRQDQGVGGCGGRGPRGQGSSPVEQELGKGDGGGGGRG